MKQMYVMDIQNLDEIYAFNIDISHNKVLYICIQNLNKPNPKHFLNDQVLHNQKTVTSIKFHDQRFFYLKMQSNLQHRVNFLQSLYLYFE